MQNVILLRDQRGDEEFQTAPDGDELIVVTRTIYNATGEVRDGRRVFEEVSKETRIRLAAGVAGGKPSVTNRRESRNEEGTRLTARTQALRKEHDAMVSPPRTRAEKAEHVAHRADLVKHGVDLAAHRRRKPDEGPVGQPDRRKERTPK